MDSTHSDIVIDDGQSTHDPELYRPAAVGRGVDTAADVDEEQLAFYREHGWLVVQQLLGPDDVARCVADIRAMIQSEHACKPQIVFEGVARDRVEHLTPDERLASVRKLAVWGDTINNCPLPTGDERITGIVQQLMGGRQPRIFQTMAMLKPAHVGREKPWHQDHAYFDISLEDRIVGVWIALDEATIDNGCMQVLDGGHRDGPRLHWKRRDWQICDTDILGCTSTAIPLKPGGALFFDSLLPHGTPHNNSPARRWAMQFHYAPEANTPIPTEQRLATFGSEGKDVTC